MHPSDYAARQARFLRESVFLKPDADRGTAGALRVHVVSARHLRNADIMSKSDPYVSVHVGLQKATTPTIQDNLNPNWNCTLMLPVPLATQIAESFRSVCCQHFVIQQLSAVSEEYYPSGA